MRSGGVGQFDYGLIRYLMGCALAVGRPVLGGGGRNRGRRLLPIFGERLFKGPCYCLFKVFFNGLVMDGAKGERSWGM